VPKCVCRRGSALDPTVEKLHVLLTPTSVVPGRKSIALLVPRSLAGRTFLVNKRNATYFNMSSQSHLYLIGLVTIWKILSKVDTFNTTLNLQNESTCILQNQARCMHEQLP